VARAAAEIAVSSSVAAMSSQATPTIAVDALRVGMFVHLDLGWMSHPFPLSSFRIASAEQIDTIRGLGLVQLRWSPEKSTLDPEPAAAPEALPAPLPSSPGSGPASIAGGLAPAVATAAESQEQARQRLRREQMVQQRAALQHCEQQYGEASREWRRTSDLVLADPQAARERTEALSRALVDKMLGQRETCIRLLGEGAGDRACAHAINVAVIALLLGKLFGLGADDLLDLGTGALLHDVGKLELSERLRHLDEGFNAGEVALYREHVAHGVTHGRRMGLSPGALLVIAQHHEHVDGSGFPKRLGGDRQTVAARIVALVNRYDNLCNPAQAGRALTPHESLSLMFAQGRQRYDATVLSSFIRMMGVYPPGSVVQLTDDRWAMVMTVNAARPLKPRVLVHDPAVPRDEALFVDLEREPTLGIRRSVKPAQLPAAALHYLAPATRVAYFFDVAPAAESAGDTSEPREAEVQR
jgi:putative nucleotidyltransferase with HDIG domain